MDFSWAGIKKSLREFWNKLSRPQKIITAAAPLLVATALIILIVWASKPQYVVIFKGSETDAAAIRNKLVDLKYPYELQDNGTTILVPQQQAAEARLQLASAGLPQGSKFSFDNLDQLHLGETDADRKLRYILGLQNELETTLKTLNGVQDARVHIVSPEPSLFTDKDKAATAAVTLKLTPGTKLSDDQVRGIANLMAASVEGLQAENVTIVDTAGNVLSDVIGKSNDPQRLTGTQLQLQQAVEDNVQKSVQSMLDRVLGPGKTVVRANAVLDFDQIKITDQRNGQGALVSRQTTNETSTNGSNTGGVPGATANTAGAPTYQTPAATGSNSSSNKASSTENYQVDTTQTERVVSPGAIKRLSISVMADSDTVSPAQVQQIQAVVASAAGINQARGDQIQVAALPFDKTTAQQTKKEMEDAARRQQWVTYAELGGGVLLTFIFLLLYWRSKSQRKRAIEAERIAGEFQNVPLADAEEILLAQKKAEQEAQLKIAQKKTKSAEEIEKQKIKEAVELYSRNNPDEVARLIKTWLSEEK